MITQKITVTGQVQGVGFRPFIYRLAQQHQLTGSVSNQSGEVSITVQGNGDAITRFTKQIITAAPPLAKPLIVEDSEIDSPVIEHFSITASRTGEQADIHIPPDYFTCEDCLDELSDPQQRRFRYPFTNCTQCGPRYTLIESLPYDRPNTSMKDFPLCVDCQKEYSSPDNRRFHAQPLACEKCGPQLSYSADGKSLQGNEASLQACVAMLKNGAVIAVKGIGGYHLMCDARNEKAIGTLRVRKHRPHKPLAVMFPVAGQDGLDSVRQYVSLTLQEAGQILHPHRPIVLVQKNPHSPLAENIAPGLNETGVFLPYSPLHHLLLNDFNGPLIATSGNLSGEPVLTANAEAQTRLGNIADGFLHHNRPIVRPADDSVMRLMAGQVMNIRAGRGMAPTEITLPGKITEPVLAVGGHLKSTVALAWDNRMVISPHISDLGTRRGVQVFEQVIADLQKLYQVAAKQVVCDAHPAYQSHRWAKRQPLPVTEIWHHHAHAAVVSGEYANTGNATDNWLTFCWDGVGLGEDNTLWGGETFFGKPGQWQHVGSFDTFHIPGADKAGRQPWRSAAALRWQTGDFSLPEIAHADIALQAWKKKFNSPQSSAAGRLFDAAANMVLHINEASYEGQGPMLLEAAADHSADILHMPITEDAHGVMRSDWSGLILALQDENQSAGYRAALFHNSMAQNIIDQALLAAKTRSFDAIGLSGGVFQNKRLTEKVFSLANKHGMRVCLPSLVPVNDGGLSFGQVIEFLGRQK